jgi:uncharacterized protein YkwD
MIRLTNVERARTNQGQGTFGSGPQTDTALLVEDAKLSSAAQKHAERMAQQQKLLSYVDVTGVFSSDEVARLLLGSLFYRADQKEAVNAAKVIQVWMRSEGDRKDILDPRHTRIGVGVAYSATGVPYYTLLVAGRRP